MESANEPVHRAQDCHLSPLVAEFCRTFSTERRRLRGAAPRYTTHSAAHRRIDRANEARQRESDRSGTVLRFENTKFRSERDRRASAGVTAIGRRRKRSYRLLQTV